MQIVIVTGMSGAGKTTALKIFEDAGFHCVDNLPPVFLSQFIQMCKREDVNIAKVALVIDIRGGKLFDDFSAALDDLDVLGLDVAVLFLDSANDELLNRYKETRHNHPLAKNDLISVGILKERAMLEDVKQRATHIIDTSRILPRQLKEQILKLFAGDTDSSTIVVNVMSFGYKYGIPQESDLVFDVRFLPNPFYNPAMRPLSGFDAPVHEYVMGYDVSVRFLDGLLTMLNFLLPHYKAEGKNQLIISIGCTGGRHRSVVLARELGSTLDSHVNTITIHHRDIDKDPSRK